MNNTVPVNEEISRPLEESLVICKQSSRLMQKNLQTGKLMDAFRNCSMSLVEMRNNALSPKQYYELYMFTTETLRRLGEALLETHLNGTHHLMDLYELVQYAGSVLPRLYLMITVGSAYLETPKALVKEIMNDLIDMCAGVQHPLRGLFLRHYLLTQTRKGLTQDPDHDDADPKTETLMDSVKFLLLNFTEMNKLWVRIQHLGPMKDYMRRTQERNELKVLVGLNLVRLSQLNFDLDTYKNEILPAIVEQVIECRDPLAQEYLSEVICQVFPDEMHLETLDIYFSTIMKLNRSVNITPLVISMLNRLTAYVQRECEVESSDREGSVNQTMQNLSLEDQSSDPENKICPGDRVISPKLAIQEVLWTYIVDVLNARNGIALGDIVQILSSILNFFLQCYPYQTQYADRVFQVINERILQQPSLQTELKERSLQKSLFSILVLPIVSFPSFSYCLNLPSFLPVFKAQPINIRYDIAKMILEKVIEKEQMISDLKDVQELFGVISVIIKNNGNDTIEDLKTIAILVHYLHNEDPQIQIEILRCLKDNFVQAGENVKYLLPVVVNKCIFLAREFRLFKCVDWAEKVRILWDFVNACIVILYNHGDSAELSLVLYLFAAEMADIESYPDFAYEFFTQAFTIYEESALDSRLQYQQLLMITGKLQKTRNFSVDDYDTLITKCTLYASKLLKKPDQCRGILHASHLWWQNETTEETVIFRDSKRVLECLQKSLKIADSCMDQITSLKLFINILEQYFYYYDQRCDSILAKHIGGLIDLTEQNMRSLLASSPNDLILNDPNAYASSIWETAGGSSVDNLRNHLEKTTDLAEKRSEDERWASIFQ
ncbi:retromer complex subunit Vps35 [Schizosaccharomyces osmophilus]|uniref:Vacuolar protein sorting-associated protein 35 n=1 Tax=Schizosaccharomyces osmophilus TaxID=2545709 RepID=A0AAE9WGG7_9SCHI|nr:retromer complex subunit Vps35 [Schizosaccharomyces osmophilus]WBW75298.1 retromer complex subunit Vps35 [Schizosaccharomyces osmophilus]